MDEKSKRTFDGMGDFSATGRKPDACAATEEETTGACCLSGGGNDSYSGAGIQTHGLPEQYGRKAARNAFIPGK